MWADTLWLDLVALGSIDPGVIVYPSRSAAALAAADDDDNTFVFNGLLCAVDGKLTFDSPEGDWSREQLLEWLPTELLDLLVWDQGVELRLPSGMVPLEQQFDAVATDVFSFGGIDYRVGARAGAYSHGIAYSHGGQTMLGVLQGRQS